MGQAHLHAQKALISYAVLESACDENKQAPENHDKFYGFTVHPQGRRGKDQKGCEVLLRLSNPQPSEKIFKYFLKKISLSGSKRNKNPSTVFAQQNRNVPQFFHFRSNFS